jgi:hypothetical protein
LRKVSKINKIWQSRIYGYFHVLVPVTEDHGSVNASYIHRESDAEASDVSDEENVMTDRSRLILPTTTTLSVRYFEYRHARYIWSSRDFTFVRLYGLDKGHPISKFTNEYMYGITREEQMGKQTVHGTNSVDVEVKSYTTLFIEEVGNLASLYIYLDIDLEFFYNSIIKI